MAPATKAQVKAINATLASKGMMNDKPNIIKELTAGRTTHSTQLTIDEAKALLKTLLSPNHTYKQEGQNKMIAKIFAMAHEMGWINNKTSVKEGGKMVTKKDYTPVYNWIKQYGYLKKDLKQYEYNEIPKLVTQFSAVYNSYLSKI